MSQGIIGPEKRIVRYDAASATLFYLGRAFPGTATSAAEWRISRFTETGSGELYEEMADGDDAYDNIWDNRTSLTYS